MNTQEVTRLRLQSPARLRLARGLGLASLTSTLLLLAGCGARVESDANPASSQTHWLQGCASAADCGGLECLCGMCTKPCEDGAGCSAFGADSVCTSLGDSCERQAQSACSKACEENDDCGDAQECAGGACRLVPVASGAPSSPELPAAPTFDSGTRGADAGTVSAPSYELGHACNDDEECASGACRSESCSERDAVCVSLSGDVECNADVAEYCGCDGTTFEGSSGGFGCARARYAYAGACGSRMQPAGASCDVNEDCKSGICEGVGCGAFEGTCVEEGRLCPSDLQSYCGCDGVMFWGGSACPGARYSEDMDCPYKASDWEPCESNDDCASGICEGEGCDAAGQCVPQDRICTDDLVPYCGCDGVFFYGSSSCPRGRYDDALECKAPATWSCNTNDDCASGICEGLGCGELGGTCAALDRACTDDEVPYCTCEGTTAYGSSSCPKVRYAAEGECP